MVVARFMGCVVRWSTSGLSGRGVSFSLFVWHSVCTAHVGQFGVTPIGHSSRIMSWAMERMFVMLVMGCEGSYGSDVVICVVCVSGVFFFGVPVCGLGGWVGSWRW